MTSRPELTFPDDLWQAMNLKGKPLAFSTIQPGDTNPHMTDGRGGAEGSIGMIVDIGTDTVIRSVSPRDSGSSPAGSFGLLPTEENCIASIDSRETSNEWFVQDYVPVGVFILPPIFVRRLVELSGEPTSAEVPLELQQAIEPFPDKTIFSANQSTFLKLVDRGSESWQAVAYDDIIPIENTLS